MKPPGPNSFTVSIVIIAEQHFTVKQLFNINSHCKFLIIYSELECTLYAKIKKKKKSVTLTNLPPIILLYYHLVFSFSQNKCSQSSSWNLFILGIFSWKWLVLNVFITCYNLFIYLTEL